MKRTTVFVFAAVLALGIIIAAGCGSDKTTNTQPDPEAAAFVESSVAQSLADGAGESINQTMELFDFPIAAPERPLNGLARAADSAGFDTVIYTYINGNHAFYFVMMDTQTVGVDSFITATVRGYDTVTLWDNNVGQPERDTTIDSLRAKLIVRVNIAGLGLDLEAVRRHQVQVGGNPWVDGSFDVDGNLVDTSNIVFSNDSGTCSLNLNSVGNVANVLLDSGVVFGNDCPVSGTIGFNAKLGLSCQGNGSLTQLNVNGTWGIAVSWDNGMQTVNLTHNGSSYTSTDSCGTGGVGKLNPWSWGY